MSEVKSIIACVNGVEPSEAVCDWSGWLSSHNKIPVSVLHTLDHQTSKVIEQSADLSGSIGTDAKDELLNELVEIEHEQNRLLLRRGNIILEKSKRRVMAMTSQNVEKVLLHGRLQKNLLDRKEQIEYLVIGRFGQAHQNSMKEGVGHKVEGVVRSLEKPILVVSKPFHEPKKLMLAYDMSESSNKALRFLIENPFLKKLSMSLVFVGEFKSGLAEEFNQAKSKLEAVGYIVDAVNLSGEVNSTLLKFSSDNAIDLIVMGAFGHFWLRDLLMGSHTSQMLTSSQIPLFLVR
jgi:nucleotide-binding universal stress UspA family protein